jgi:hypothetical protein
VHPERFQTRTKQQYISISIFLVKSTALPQYIISSIPEYLHTDTKSSKYTETMASEITQLLARTNTAALPATSTGAKSTISPFATALNGVDQPMNDLFKILIWSSLAGLAMLILIIRLFQRWRAHMRHMTAMNLSGGQQTYWAKNRSKWWWKFKKHVLYAPLWKKRHNREFRLSSALNMGTIPGRFHTILLAAFIFSNIGYMLALSYSREDRYSVAAELRGRAGVLAMINMIALVILAGRNNLQFTPQMDGTDDRVRDHRSYSMLGVRQGCCFWLVRNPEDDSD